MGSGFTVESVLRFPPRIPSQVGMTSLPLRVTMSPEMTKSYAGGVTSGVTPRDIWATPLVVSHAPLSDPPTGL